MQEWKKTILDFVKMHGSDVLQLKKLESELRQFKKSIEGTSAYPSEYTLGKKTFVENWDAILELASETDEDIKLVNAGTPKLIINTDNITTEISVSTRKIVDSTAILEQLVLDGKLTADELTKYKEDNTKISKSFSIK